VTAGDLPWGEDHDRKRKVRSETGLWARVAANTATANIYSLSASVLSTWCGCASNYEPLLSAKDAKDVETVLVAATSTRFIHAAASTSSSSKLGRGVSAMPPGAHTGPTTTARDTIHTSARGRHFAGVSTTQYSSMPNSNGAVLRTYWSSVFGPQLPVPRPRWSASKRKIVASCPFCSSS